MKDITLDKALNFLAESQSVKAGFGKLEAGILKAMLMLAAVDGEVSAEEIDRFRDQALACSGCTGEAFAALWREALHSAGYLALQAKRLSKDNLAEEFVREAEPDFVTAVAAADRVKWTQAFDCLNAIASADGKYSGVEKACVNALVKRVKDVREKETQKS